MRNDERGVLGNLLGDLKSLEGCGCQREEVVGLCENTAAEEHDTVSLGCSVQDEHGNLSGFREERHSGDVIYIE